MNVTKFCGQVSSEEIMHSKNTIPHYEAHIIGTEIFEIEQCDIAKERNK